MALTFCVLAGKVEKLQCRVPSDSDAAVRVSQMLQFARLVQASQNPVSVQFVHSNVHLLITFAIATDTPICTSNHVVLQQTMLNIVSMLHSVWADRA